MGIRFEDAFSQVSSRVCSAFFQQPESVSKNWQSLETLVEADEATFWAVVSAHNKFPMVIDLFVRAVDESHATASPKHRVSRENERNLACVLLRIMTTQPNFPVRVSPSSIALRLAHIIPASTLLPIALLFLRSSGTIASTAITSFLLLSPVALAHFAGVTAVWYDTITQIAAKCVTEAKRGRFQRQPGDVLPLIERSYRATKHMWALIHSAPYLADYLDIKKAILGLRIVVEIISPLIQHFILTADALAARRAQLTKANAMLLNAAVSTATILTIVTPFCKKNTALANQQSSLRSQQSCGEIRQPIGIGAMKQFEDACSGYVVQYCNGWSGQLLKNNRRVADMFQAIVPGGVHRNKERLFHLFQWLTEPIPNCKDFSAGIREGEERLAPLIILELVNQGFHIERLRSEGFVTEEEAQGLGAKSSLPEPSNSTQHQTAAPSTMFTTTQDAAADEEDEGESGDPMVDMVRGILPHLCVSVVRKGLEYYEHNVERFIDEALSGNLPPHLQEEHDVRTIARQEMTEAQSHSAPPAASPPSLQTNKKILQENEDDAWMAAHVDMETFISSDYMENAAGPYQAGEGEGDEGEETMMTLHPFSSTMSETLYVDDGYKAHSFEFLYEDERDDAEEGEGHAWGAIGDQGSEDDDEQEQLRPLNRPLASSDQPHQSSAAIGNARGVRGNNARGGDDKQHGNSKRNGGGKPAIGVAPVAAAYAAKKVKKERKGATGGGKTAVMRAFKKGGGGGGD